MGGRGFADRPFLFVEISSSNGSSPAGRRMYSSGAAGTRNNCQVLFRKMRRIPIV